MDKLIKVAKEFSDMPYGRYEKDGNNNGTRFRDEILIPALKSHDRVIIDLEGVLGSGSSFLDEAFGGLVRKRIFSKQELIDKIEIKYKYKSVIKNIYKYIDEASKSLTEN